MNEEVPLLQQDDNLGEIVFGRDDRVSRAWAWLRQTRKSEGAYASCLLTVRAVVMLFSASIGIGVGLLAWWGVELLYSTVEEHDGGVEGWWLFAVIMLAAAAVVMSLLVFCCLVAILRRGLVKPLAAKISLYHMTTVNKDTRNLLLLSDGTTTSLPPSHCKRTARHLENGLPLQWLVISIRTEPGSLECIFDAVADVEKISIGIHRALTQREGSALARMMRRCEGLRWVHIILYLVGSFPRPPCEELIGGLAGAENLEWVMLDGFAWGAYMPAIADALAQRRHLETVDFVEMATHGRDLRYAVDKLLLNCPNLRSLNVVRCISAASRFG